MFSLTAKRENIYTQTDSQPDSQPDRQPAVLPPSDSIWTVNEEDEIEKSITDSVNQESPAILQVKSKQSQSAPVLNHDVTTKALPLAALLPTNELAQQLSVSSSARSITASDEAPSRMEILPLLQSKQSSTASVQVSSTSLCKTIDGVPLVAEKVLVFSYDSFVAGGISAQSSLPELTDKLTEELESKEPDYNRVSLLRSTEL